MFSFTFKKNQPLAPYTWFKIGGNAEYLTISTSSDDLASKVGEANKLGIPFTVLGGGSNVLISDHGLPGLVIINRSQSLEVNNLQIKVDTGVPLSRLVNQANRLGLAGLAGFLGIPGTVGGAVFNNSHYQNQLIGQLIESVEVTGKNSSKRLSLTQDQCDFKYDYSRFHESQEAILNVVLHLSEAPPEDLITLSREALHKRRQTQPLELPSSGCMFKNLKPEEVERLKLPTASVGFLIDRLGLKGKTVGGAMISTLHANFIVNHHNALAQDVYQLVKLIQAKVWETYRLDLETEVLFKGEFRE